MIPVLHGKNLPQPQLKSRKFPYHNPTNKGLTRKIKNQQMERKRTKDHKGNKRSSLKERTGNEGNGMHLIA